MKTINIGILGSGNIGCDTLVKVKLSKFLVPSIIVGRRKDSEGLCFSQTQGVKTSCDGISAIINYKPKLDIVFDATSAEAHLQNIALLDSAGIKVINLTPAMLHFECIPAINLNESLKYNHISMSTCGGQASAAIAFALSQAHEKIEYIEAVSSVSAKSAGIATRNNIDEYLKVTESVIKRYSNCGESKAILTINPVEPCIDMQITIYALIEKPNVESIKKQLIKIVKKVQSYVPGYQLISEPIIEGNQITIILKIRGAGHYLPAYAGNLDILTSAAIKVAEHYAKHGGSVCF